MKQTSLLAAIIVSVFLIGCQDSNNPIAPNQKPVTPVFIKSAGSVPQGTIVLDAQLICGYGNIHEVVYRLSGAVQYALTPEDHGSKYHLSLGVDATLAQQNGNGEFWKVQSESSEELAILEETYLYSKVFEIEGIPDRRKLFIQFNVSTDKMEIEKIALIDVIE